MLNRASTAVLVRFVCQHLVMFSCSHALSTVCIPDMMYITEIVFIIVDVLPVMSGPKFAVDQLKQIRNIGK